MLGPFTANTSDSKLLEHSLKTSDFLRSLFEPGDIFILDRGFRDVEPYLKDRGFDVKMPHFLDAGKNQLTWEQANKTRLAAKCRFAVEIVNGKLY